jgi:hypothetical protein
MLAMMDATCAQGNTRDPAQLKPFIAQGQKMILYHGASDPSIPASQSIAFYRELAEQQQGIERTQESVRLFLVPGMSGPGPPLQWCVRHAIRHRGMGRARQGSGCDPGEHQAGKPGAAPAAAVPLSAAGSLSWGGSDHRSLELELRGGNSRVAMRPGRICALGVPTSRKCVLYIGERS